MKPLRFSEITHCLEEKSPRFLIAIADCCNTYISEWHLPVHLQYTQDVEFNYRPLFQDSTGVILISSSSPGEASKATSYGGLYTLSFLRNLHLEVEESFPNWTIILERSALEVMHHQTVQTRHFN